MIDDRILYGATEDEHDCRFRAVLDHCQESGLRLKPEKSKFRAREVTFFGYILTGTGLRPDETKLRT